jgi:DNA-binding MarR family transcriptional regulator
MTPMSIVLMLNELDSIPVRSEVRDRVDVIVEQWHEQYPDLDVPAKKLTIRLRRLAHHIEREVQRELAAHDIGMWELEVLLALRRAPNRQLSVGDLVRRCQVTSGAMTNRIARLAERGWVTRELDPDDRRQVIVTLTRAGLRRANQILDTKIVAEERLFSALDAATRDRLNADLQALLVSVEGPADDYEPQPGEAAHLAP